VSIISQVLSDPDPDPQGMVFMEINKGSELNSDSESYIKEFIKTVFTSTIEPVESEPAVEFDTMLMDVGVAPLIESENDTGESKTAVPDETAATVDEVRKLFLILVTAAWPGTISEEVILLQDDNTSAIEVT